MIFSLDLSAMRERRTLIVTRGYMRSRRAGPGVSRFVHGSLVRAAFVYEYVLRKLVVVNGK